MKAQAIKSNIQVQGPSKPGSFTPAARIWFRVLLFLAPVLALTALPVALVDPFNVFSEQSLGASWEVKRYFGEAINSVLWKLPQFDRAPGNNILLGDSQMYRLRTEDIQAIDRGHLYFNLAYGGGTLVESIASFWHAASLTELRSVYFEVSFLSYNPDQRNRVIEAEKLLHNRAEYLGNPDALQASYYELLSHFPGGRMKMGTTMDQSTFWNYRLEIAGNRLRNLVYPAAEKRELERIADYCQRKHILLFFVITPQHIDAQRLVDKLGVSDNYVRFKNDLSSIAPTIDCDIANPFTADRGNYSDPFHPLERADAVVIDDIWGGKFKLCHRLGQW